MTPEMIAALAQDRAFVTGLFEFDFASGTRRLMLGSGEVQYKSTGLFYKGFDDTFGSIESGDELREDASGEAPNTTLTINLADGVDKAQVAASDVQLTPVKIFLAAIEFGAGNRLRTVDDPELLFDGFIDQPVINLDGKQDEVTYSIISAFDYFFEDDEGQRLNGPFHKSIWPGEKGLDNVTGVTKKIYWGTYGPGAAGGVASGGYISGSTGGSVAGGGYTARRTMMTHYA